jgi:hypothetical protein
MERYLFMRILDTNCSLDICDRGTVVLHWFTGSAAEARRASVIGDAGAADVEFPLVDPHRPVTRRLPLVPAASCARGAATSPGRLPYAFCEMP